MKKILFYLTLMTNTFVFSQSCCQLNFASSDGNMAVFTTDQNFIASHLSPLTYNHNSEVGGKMITFPTNDGKNAIAYAVMAKKKTNNWLFVYQEWWGLNDHIKKQSDIFFNELKGDVNVLAIDMYDGKIATKPEEAAKYMQSADEKRLETIVLGALSFAGKKAKIASIGWCFGGGWSLKSAILIKKQAIGAVMYYGMPIKDIEKLRTLNCDVLGLFATEEWISKEIIEEFSENMKKANEKLNYKIFESEHAFANPSNPKYNEKDATEANKMAIDYLKKKFQIR